MEVILHKNFKTNVRLAIDWLEINQSELARRLNVSAQLVSEYLRTNKCPSLDMVERFATALHVTDPWDLLSPSFSIVCLNLAEMEHVESGI
ncbi:helix-turn-helix domain-containing protein [Planctomicrobium sp. SH661]|uniref:helix-turn-helix domain-containing protein n=1 Tax=Planctomicrobium sp. SH661 TaxID=3448124 RepID=UPI003F5B7812